jgi:hypothetical protein
MDRRKLGQRGVVLLVALLATSALPSSVCAASLLLDLPGGTLNEQPVVSWTLDDITNLLGRPSAVEDPVKDIVGARLLYHQHGVMFWFQPPKQDPRQHLWLVSTRVVRTWDRDFSKYFEAFQGFSPAVSGDWKAERILKEFATLNPTVETAESRQQEWSKLGVRGRPARLDEVIRLRLKGHQVAFGIEPNTKFLEGVTLTAEP